MWRGIAGILLLATLAASNAASAQDRSGSGTGSGAPPNAPASEPPGAQDVASITAFVDAVQGMLAGIGCSLVTSDSGGSVASLSDISQVRVVCGVQGGTTANTAQCSGDVASALSTAAGLFSLLNSPAAAAFSRAAAERAASMAAEQPSPPTPEPAASEPPLSADSNGPLSSAQVHGIQSIIAMILSESVRLAVQGCVLVRGAAGTGGQANMNEADTQRNQFSRGLRVLTAIPGINTIASIFSQYTNNLANTNNGLGGDATNMQDRSVALQNIPPRVLEHCPATALCAPDDPEPTSP